MYLHAGLFFPAFLSFQDLEGKGLAHPVPGPLYTSPMLWVKSQGYTMTPCPCAWVWVKPQGYTMTPCPCAWVWVKSQGYTMTLCPCVRVWVKSQGYMMLCPCIRLWVKSQSHNTLRSSPGFGLNRRATQ